MRPKADESVISSVICGRTADVKHQTAMAVRPHVGDTQRSKVYYRTAVAMDTRLRAVDTMASFIRDELGS